MSEPKHILVVATADPVEAMRVAAGLTIFGHQVSFLFSQSIEIDEEVEKGGDDLTQQRIIHPLARIILHKGSEPIKNKIIPITILGGRYAAELFNRYNSLSLQNKPSKLVDVFNADISSYDYQHQCIILRKPSTLKWLKNTFSFYYFRAFLSPFLIN